MEPRRLVLFAAVIQHGSLSRAAAALHMTQPSLSRQIASLEREVGVRLLHRLPGGVAPTAAGERLRLRADAVRGQIEAARREIAAVRGLELGEVRLAAFPTAAATLAIDTLLILRERHPELRVAVEERDGHRARERVIAGQADIAVTFTDFDDSSDGLLETTPLLEEPMLLAVPASHPLTLQAKPTLSDLADEGWIIGTNTHEPGLIARTCLQAGFEPRVVARLDSQPAIQAAVAAAVGVTLIPALGARGHRPDIALLRLHDPSPSRRVFAHVAAGPRQPAVDAGLAALRTAAQRERSAQSAEADPL